MHISPGDFVDAPDWEGVMARGMSTEISGCYDCNWKKASVLCSETPLPLKQSFPYRALSKWLEAAAIVRQTHSCERWNFKTCNTGWRTLPVLPENCLVLCYTLRSYIISSLSSFLHTGQTYFSFFSLASSLTHLLRCQIPSWCVLLGWHELT